jgi:hypothetical protein
MHSISFAHSRWSRFGALFLALVLGAPFARAQQTNAKPPSAEQLSQLVAPIALYPDSLLAQVLMASTYPLEVVKAARWVKAHPGLEGKALEDAMQGQTWDASIKSLTAFSQVLGMMNDKLDWTTQLGNAFLADQKAVMNAVQVLRKKAKDQGNLKSNTQQSVTEVPATADNTSQTIVIQPASPQVVYVPTYNPTLVYGPWAYPAYPPFYWYPPGYVATTSMVSFGVGLAVGATMWGHCNWGRGNVDININKYNSFNRTRINNVNWKHDARHRLGAPYGNRDLENRLGSHQLRDANARDAFRGRAQQGRQEIARGQADRFKGRDPAGLRNVATGRRTEGAGFSDLKNSTRDLGRSNRGGLGQSSRRGSALSGIGGGRESLRHSARGLESRSGRSRSSSGLGSRRSSSGGRHGGFGGRRRR